MMEKSKVNWSKMTKNDETGCRCSRPQSLLIPVTEEWRWPSVVIRNSIINQNLIMIMKFLFLSEVSRVLGVSRRCQERTWRHQRREWGKISFIRASRKSQSWRPCQERTWRHQRRLWGKAFSINVSRKGQSWRPCQDGTPGHQKRIWGNTFPCTASGHQGRVSGRLFVYKACGLS